MNFNEALTSNFFSFLKHHLFRYKKVELPSDFFNGVPIQKLKGNLMFVSFTSAIYK